MAKHPKDRSKKSGPQHTSLDKHGKKGTKLIPPLATVPTKAIDWQRDLLPEHLWIAALLRSYPYFEAYAGFSDVLDTLDPLMPPGACPHLGMISDFGRVPPQHRIGWFDANRDLVEKFVFAPLERALGFYPDCPAAWLVDGFDPEHRSHLDPGAEIPRIRDLVLALLPGKDNFCCRLRVFPFARLLKHGRVRLAPGIDPGNALARYPSRCSEEERERVESLARSQLLLHYSFDPIYSDAAWPKYFWRHNYDLTTCFAIADSGPECPWDAETLAKTLDTNGSLAFQLLDTLTDRQRCDLYEPSRGEVLTGLVVRTLRLFCILIADDTLWPSDTMRILLRCIAESVITLAYLAIKGDDDDFERFVAFGEGQVKLEMLHRQDSHPDAVALDGRTLDQISDGLGAFRAEILPIELDNWTKLSIREMASAAGIPEFARLVFAPTSGDVHGTWTSLAAANLTRCMEILHRGHRIPRVTAPIVQWEGLIVAHQLAERAIQVAKDALGCPVDKNLIPLPEIQTG